MVSWTAVSAAWSFAIGPTTAHAVAWTAKASVATHSSVAARHHARSRRFPDSSARRDRRRADIRFEASVIDRRDRLVTDMEDPLKKGGPSVSSV